MKRVVSVVETDGDGLVSLMGKRVQLWCMNYIYAGVLVGVNEKDVALRDAGVVYETGELRGDEASDLQLLPGPEWFVRTAAIESYGLAQGAKDASE